VTAHTLPLSVAAVVLVAAVAHASWNAIAHGIRDQLVAFTLVGAGGALCAVPLVLLSQVPHARSWPYLAASVAVHIAYFVLLMQSYRLGDFSQAYPLARGTSPLVVTILAAVFAGEIPPPAQIAGVLIISAGLMGLVFVGQRREQVPRAAMAAAFATGLTIASYTTIDGLGVRLSGSPAGYTGWLILCEGPVLPLYALARRRRALLEQLRPVWALGIAGGALSILAYGLVLWAQTQGALGPIAALRETSIIIGALIGTVFFHERFGRPRILAAALVAAGILILNAGW
jgi:drug/metabolite transporter (DMT)-like permease